MKRPKLTSADRLLWVWLCRVWSDWRSALIIVQPDTVVAWHRKGFRLFWKWKIRCRRPGRPSVPHDLRELIRRLSRENSLWGAPRIHGDLLKLGIDVGETSVGKYMRRHRRPPSQTWRIATIRRLVAFYCWPGIAASGRSVGHVRVHLGARRSDERFANWSCASPETTRSGAISALSAN
jgi:hypothetical protein